MASSLCFLFVCFFPLRQCCVVLFVLLILIFKPGQSSNSLQSFCLSLLSIGFIGGPLSSAIRDRASLFANFISNSGFLLPQPPSGRVTNHYSGPDLKYCLNPTSYHRIVLLYWILSFVSVFLCYFVINTVTSTEGGGSLKNKGRLNV